MKVLVPIKRVVDYNVKIRVAADRSGVDTQGVKMSMNPFDEIAVEEGIRLREKGAVQEVVVVTIGPQAAQDILRTAMAMGADRAILVKTEHTLEPRAVANVLKAIIERETPGLVCMGKQAIDDDMNATGQILAAKLGWPQATFASQISLADQHANIVREIDGGTATLALSLPAIVTVDLRLNEPRYASLPNIMKARKKPLETLDIECLNVDTAARLETISVAEPPERPAGVMVKTVTDLVEKLRTEAKVI